MYDLIIIGAGPAGLAAALYASRYRLNALVLGPVVGGTALEAYNVENYPGFKSISGLELMNKMEEQVTALGVEIIPEEAREIKRNTHFTLTTESKKHQAKAVILAMGTERRKLNVPGEKELLGKGVSYCATCDAAFFRNKTVAVIGGSDAAAKSALLLAEYASKVYIIYRRTQIRAEPVTVEAVEKNDKIEIIYQTNVKEIKGEKLVEGVVLDNEYQASNFLKVDGVFVEIGAEPNNKLARDLGVELDEAGYVSVDPMQKTNVEGVFAAGDVTNAAGELKQIVTACAQGVIAATSAYEYLKTGR